MPKLVGALAALVALAGGILGGVEPVTVLWRASLAFMLGWLLTLLWYVFFTVQVRPMVGTKPETTSREADTLGGA